MARLVPVWLFPLFALAAVPTQAGPDDLLKQAIAEDETAAARSAEEVRNLVGRADRLVEQRKFDEAIALYERAYRRAPSNRSNYARLLVAKRVAGRMTSEDRDALQLIREQESAHIDQVFRLVRLDILQSRQALRGGDTALAAVKLDHAEAALDGLPKYVDDKPYRRQLSDLRIVARRKAGKLEKLPWDTSHPQGDRPADADSVNRAGDGRESVLTLMDAPDEVQPSPTGEILDVDALLAESQERHAYDRALTQALRKSRAAWLLSNNEAALPPMADLTYPEDWPERTAIRAKYRDGVIYESEPFTGPDGKTYTTAIYDLGDLVQPVPNFYPAYPGTAWERRTRMLDRHYLRERSFIFNGYAEDLAAGLPLLHFFGGIDNYAITRRADPIETERIIQIIERFIDNE